jgi:hypothetical protein
VSNPRIFFLYRQTDVTGVSGTGIVAEGVQFSDGTCAMRWRTEISSTAVYASLEDLVKIHGHDGATVPIDQHGEAIV